MRKLGVYKLEFEPIIDIYGDLKSQYDALTEKFEQSGFDFAEDTNVGTKKAPIVTTLESLRKDILIYAQQLGITPKGLQQLRDDSFAEQKKSSFADILAEMDKKR